MSQYTAPLWSSSALITIDTQQDTLDGRPFEIPGTSAILPRMKAILEAYRKGARPIIHIVRIYRPDGSNVDLCRKEMVEQGAALLLAGSQGCEPAPGLLPDTGIGLDADLLLAGGIQSVGPREVVIYKPRWGAFYHTPLEEHLRSAGISTLVFTGCNFPNCPRTSVYEAGERDFRIVVVDDAVSGMYPKAREEMRSIGVALLTADQVIEAIQAHGDTTT